MNDSEWDEMIAWCPTQLSKKVYVEGIELILYLRWRHNDPFTYNIYIEGDEKELEELLKIGIFNYDLFDKYNRWYSQEDFDKDKIEKDAEDIWYNFEKPRIEKILKDNLHLII